LKNNWIRFCWLKNDKKPPIQIDLNSGALQMFDVLPSLQLLTFGDSVENFDPDEEIINGEICR